MNRKQKIIVSITGIFIVLLALVGLTYAYFLTRIRGNEKDKSISVTTANLELVYGNDNGSIIGDGELIEPDTTFETKTFTVTNNGNATVDNYAVILEDVKTYYNQAFTDENNTPIAAGTQVAFERPQDFEINVTCKITASPTTANIGKDCTGYTGTLPLMESETLDETYITNGILLTNSIEVGETQTYSVVLKYKEANTDQSDDMNKGLQGKLNIIDTNNTVDLVGTVSNDDNVDAIVTNSTRRESQINSDGTYKIVGLEADVHSIKKKVGNTETEIGKISIVKGKSASVGETTYNGATIPEITITDDSRTSTIDINISGNVLTPSNVIKDYNPFIEGTLTYNIYKNVKENKNGTVYSKEPLTNPGVDISSSWRSGEFMKEYISTNSLIAGFYLWLIGNTESEAQTGSPVDSYEEAVGSYVYDRGFNQTKYLEAYNSSTSMLTFRVEKITGESVVSLEEDNDGISYYYRGLPEDNYVTFAGMCWKIVRIDGNGNTKLILEDQDEVCSTTMNGNWDIEASDGTTITMNNSDKVRLGNFGGEYPSGIITYLNPVYKPDQSMVNAFKYFQTNTLTNKISSTYEDKSLSDYLVSGNWCLNNKAYSDELGNTFVENPDYTIGLFYDSYVRLKGNSTKKPTLKCPVKTMETYGDNIIPMYVGTLTADELVYAGTTDSISNPNFYLLNKWQSTNSTCFWSFSPYAFVGSNSLIYTLTGDGYIDYETMDSAHSFRPAVSLKSNTKIVEGGEGTLEKPYIIG